MPLSISSIKTLRGYGVFTKVITQGKRYEKRPIKAFIFLSRSNHTEICVGFTVTKKVCTAVHRNRIKRLMREAFRINVLPLIHGMKASGRIEIVFMYSNYSENLHKRENFSYISDAIKEICAKMEIAFD